MFLTPNAGFIWKCLLFYPGARYWQFYFFMLSMNVNHFYICLKQEKCILSHKKMSIYVQKMFTCFYWKTSLMICSLLREEKRREEKRREEKRREEKRREEKRREEKRREEKRREEKRKYGQGVRGVFTQTSCWQEDNSILPETARANGWCISIQTQGQMLTHMQKHKHNLKSWVKMTQNHSLHT